MSGGGPVQAFPASILIPAFAAETVAEAAHRLDKPWRPGIVAELLAQLADVHVDHPVDDGLPMLVDPLEKLLPGEDPAAGSQQGPQKPELHCGQFQLPVVQGHPVPGVVELQAAARQDFGARRFGSGPAQNRLDPLDQLAGAEGFDHVVVGAQGESEDTVDLLLAGGQKQDRHRGDLAQFATDFPAVGPGEHDVENDKPRRPAPRQLQGCGAVADPAGIEPLPLQVARHQGRRIGIVLDDQYRAGELGRIHLLTPSQRIAGRTTVSKYSPSCGQPQPVRKWSRDLPSHPCSG